jgi:hypothetical protein
MGADAVKSISYTGSGTEFSFGQAYNAGGPWPAWPDKSYTRTISYETPGWRVDRVLADVPPGRKRRIAAGSHANRGAESE